jgi:ribosome maturation protein SDO1
MVKVEDAIVARLQKGDRKFEILVDPFKAQEFLQGKAKIEEVIAVQDIFKDVKSGDRVTEDSLKEVFKTTDPLKVAEQILKTGDLQLTTEQKRKMVEEKRNQIIENIVRNALDPQTGLPHPRSRIENALEQVRISVDPFKPASEQTESILIKLRPIIPIRFERKKMAVRIPTAYAIKSYSYVKSLGITSEQWLNDGSLVVGIEVPGGMQTEVIDRLNALTKGEVEVKLL